MVGPDGESRSGGGVVTAIAAPRAGAAVRRERILERLARDGRVDVGDLAGVLAVTEETIRRDLRALEDQNLLRRAHGGAISVAAGEPLPSDDGRAAMAAAVADIVSERSAVFIGAGQGCEAVAVLLARRRGVQLIVGSAAVALAAALSNDDAQVHVIGGNVHADGSLSGMWAREQLAALEVDVCVVEAEGLARDGYLLTSDPERAAVQSAAFAAARTVVLLENRDSMTGSGHVKYARLSDVDHVVVGPGMRGIDLDRLYEADLDVIRIDGGTES